MSTRKLPLPNVGKDRQSVRQRVEAMERVMERLATIPGTKQQVGLDVILDLVPVVGDIAAAGLGAYIVWEARNLGISWCRPCASSTKCFRGRSRQHDHRERSHRPDSA